jgi:hypothetical protein
MILSLLAFFAIIAPFTHAIKFTLPAARAPVPKCIWNAAHTHALVIVTANVGPGGTQQRVDVEILDSTPHRNVYLSKRDIKGETRLAVTAHGEGEVGVCFKNYLSPGTFVVIRCRAGNCLWHYRYQARAGAEHVTHH